jgi:fructose-1,6-bisphosphatase/inositol monophosphatase family enzyme
MPLNLQKKNFIGFVPHSGHSIGMFVEGCAKVGLAAEPTLN